MQVVIKSFSATVNLGIVKFKISRKAKEKKEIGTGTYVGASAPYVS